MSRAFRDLIRLLVNGEDIASEPVNRALRAVGGNAAYLMRQFKLASAAQTVFARGQTIDPRAQVGQPVYYDAQKQRWSLARAAAFFDNDGNRHVAAQAQAWGILYEKLRYNQADLLLCGTAELDMRNVLGDDPVSGQWYLSELQAGQLTRQPVSLAIPLLKVVGPGQQPHTTVVTVDPNFHDLVNTHRHLRFELTTEPAGTAELTDGVWTFTDTDTDREGWLPADHAIFNDLAPAGAVLGYNLSASRLGQMWPPSSLSTSYAILDRGETVLRLGQGADGLLIIDENGLWWRSDCEDEVPWTATTTTTTTEEPTTTTTTEEPTTTTTTEEPGTTTTTEEPTTTTTTTAAPGGFVPGRIWLHRGGIDNQVYSFDPDNPPSQAYPMDSPGESGQGLCLVDDYVYWVEGDTIRRGRVSGASQEEVLPLGAIPGYSLQGLAFDSVNRQIYVGTSGALFRMSLTGTGLTQLASYAHGSVAVAVYADQNRIFISSNGNSNLNVHNLAGTFLYQIVTSGTVSALAVDRQRNKVYYYSPINLLRANLDGSSQEIVSTLSMLHYRPSAMVVDEEAGYLYVVTTDVFSSDNNGRLLRFDITGTLPVAAETLEVGLHLNYVPAIDVYANFGGDDIWWIAEPFQFRRVETDGTAAANWDRGPGEGEATALAADGVHRRLFWAVGTVFSNSFERDDPRELTELSEYPPAGMVCTDLEYEPYTDTLWSVWQLDYSFAVIRSNGDGSAPELWLISLDGHPAEYTILDLEVSYPHDKFWLVLRHGEGSNHRIQCYSLDATFSPYDMSIEADSFTVDRVTGDAFWLLGGASRDPEIYRTNSEFDITAELIFTTTEFRVLAIDVDPTSSRLVLQAENLSGNESRVYALDYDGSNLQLLDHVGVGASASVYPAICVAVTEELPTTTTTTEEPTTTTTTEEPTTTTTTEEPTTTTTTIPPLTQNQIITTFGTSTISVRLYDDGLVDPFDLELPTTISHQHNAIDNQQSRYYLISGDRLNVYRVNLDEDLSGFELIRTSEPGGVGNGELFHRLRFDPVYRQLYIGTANGIWQMDESGDGAVRVFTSTGEPLLNWDVHAAANLLVVGSATDSSLKLYSLSGVYQQDWPIGLPPLSLQIDILNGMAYYLQESGGDLGVLRTRLADGNSDIVAVVNTATAAFTCLDMVHELLYFSTDDGDWYTTGYEGGLTALPNIPDIGSDPVYFAYFTPPEPANRDYVFWLDKTASATSVVTLERVDLDGTNRMTVVDYPPANHSYGDFALNPKTHRVYYTSSYPGGSAGFNRHIYAVDYDGGNQTLIASLNLNGFAPGTNNLSAITAIYFEADSQQLYAMVRPTPSPATAYLWRLEPDGSLPTQVLGSSLWSATTTIDLSVYPDADFVYTNYDAIQLSKIRLSTGAHLGYLNAGLFSAGVTINHDAAKLYLTSYGYSGSIGEVFVCNPDGTGRTSLVRYSSPREQTYHVAVHEGSGRIFFGAKNSSSGLNYIRRIDADGTNDTVFQTAANALFRIAVHEERTWPEPTTTTTTTPPPPEHSVWWIESPLIYGNDASNVIKYAELDGSNVRTFAAPFGYIPKALTVDNSNGLLFIHMYTPLYAEVIVRVEVTGDNPVVIWTAATSELSPQPLGVWSLVYDHEEFRLWISGRSASSQTMLFSMLADGTDEVLATNDASQFRSISRSSTYDSVVGMAGLNRLVQTDSPFTSRTGPGYGLTGSALKHDGASSVWYYVGDTVASQIQQQTPSIGFSGFSTIFETDLGQKIWEIQFCTIPSDGLIVAISPSSGRDSGFSIIRVALPAATYVTLLTVASPHNIISLALYLPGETP